MKREMTRMTVFAAALALAMPAVMGVEQGEALAVGSVVSSRSGGKRTHKAASKRSSSSSSSKKRTTTTTTRTSGGRTHYSSGSQTRTETGRTRRPAGSVSQGRTTTTTTSRTRTNQRPRYGGPHHHHGGSTTTTTVSGGRRTTTTTTTTTTRSNHRRYYYDNGPVYYSPAPARRTTVVNNNYYYGQTQQPPATVYEDNYRDEAPREEDDGSQAYITGTVGLGGMSASKISDEALPGIDFNVGLGGRVDWLAMELGFGMGGYRLDPAASSSDLLLLGTSLDLKLQPNLLGFLEPYVMAGVGGQYFRDYVVDTSALGGSLRLGAGLDLRFEDLAVTFRYTFSQHGWLEDDRGIYPDQSLSAQTETVGVGLTLYF